MRFTKVGEGLYEIHAENRTIGFAQKAVRDEPNQDGSRTKVEGWFALDNFADHGGEIWATRADAGRALLGEEPARRAKERTYR